MGDERAAGQIELWLQEALELVGSDRRAAVLAVGEADARNRAVVAVAVQELHRDLPDNLYAQIVGHKKFFLLDRRLTRMVHRHSFRSGVPNYSPVDAETPDLARHSRFRGAPLMVAEVEPGDLLYIPSMWWHQAHSIDTSVALNLWWVRGPMVVVARAAELCTRWREISITQAVSLPALSRSIRRLFGHGIAVGG